MSSTCGDSFHGFTDSPLRTNSSRVDRPLVGTTWQWWLNYHVAGLVYVAHVPAQQAVGMSLVIVGGTSVLGSLLHLRQGDFDLRAATFFSLSGIGGAFVGAKFTHLVSAPMLLLLFGTLMLVVGTGDVATR